METLDPGKSHRRRQQRIRKGPTARTLPPGRAPVGFVAAQTAAHLIRTKDNIETEREDSSGPRPTIVSCDTTERRLQPVQDESQDFRPSNTGTQQDSSSSTAKVPSNMHTFGSMARAAEYAAARAANARQVSREAEEQKLPPKSTPISLSAFTKGQPTSRNKGNKSWKPLTTDDLGGDEEGSNNLTTHEQTRFWPENDDDPTSFQRLLANSAQITTEELKIPTAPKAMLSQRGMQNARLDPAPHRLSANPAFGTQRPQDHPAPDGTPGHSTRGGSLFSMPQVPYHPSRGQRAAYLPENLQFLGTHADEADPMHLMPAWGDNELQQAAYLTPTRDEIAEVLRERDHQHMLNMANLQPGIAPPPPFGLFGDSPVHYYYPTAYDLSGYGQQQPLSFEVTPPSYYPPEHMVTRSEVPRVMHATPLSYPALRTNLDQSSALHYPEYRKPDIPYDRARMMEIYKATLAKEALERKGKTVLHNPELRKQSEQQTPSIVDSFRESVKQPLPETLSWQDLEHKMDECKRDSDPTEKLEAESEARIEPNKTNKIDSFSTHTDVFVGNASGERFSLRAPPPGLELLTDCSGGSKGNGLKEFPDNFYTLRPLSMAEVKIVQELSQRARDELAGTVKQPLKQLMNGEPINTARAKESDNWFYRHADRQNALAEEVYERAVKNNAIEKKNKAEMAADKAFIGNVIGNVKYYLQQCHLPEGKRTLPFKIKPVPDYATERPSVLTGGSSTFSSFFEESSTKGDAEKAFIPTPRRIARDPRFRTQAPKDGGKVNFEEERMARRDSYGRRAL